MKSLLKLCLAAVVVCSGLAVQAETPAGFDAGLAERLGADVYGMRTYVMVHLRAGPGLIEDAERLAEIQRGHMAHIRHLSEEGHLIMAGPFLDGGELRGIFLLALDDLEQAAELVAGDPAVQAGRLEMELIRWYGSAALMSLPEMHARIASAQP